MSDSSYIASLPEYEDGAGLMVVKIEQILGNVLDGLVSGSKELHLPCANRRGNRPRTVRFPGRTSGEARHFARLIAILELSRAALIKGSVMTKRDLYYRDVELFGSQRVVDRLVDDLAATLGGGRESLNIMASPKGQIAGTLRLTLRDGSVIDFSNVRLGQTPVVPPPVKNIRRVDFADARWLLVVEKDASWKTLAHSQFHRQCLAGPGILVTAKGFPDLATRALLHLLHLARPQMPLFALVDWDSYGISIMRTYKYGSRALKHEANVTLPTLRWLGIRSHDLFHPVRPDVDDISSSQRSLSQQHSVSLYSTPLLSTEHDYDANNGLSQMPRTDSVGPLSEKIAARSLNPRDRKHTVNLLSAVCRHDHIAHEEWEQAHELQRMLVLNVKAEIQHIHVDKDMTEWLNGRLADT